jgi:hypothetical protein
MCTQGGYLKLPTTTEHVVYILGLPLYSRPRQQSARRSEEWSFELHHALTFAKSMTRANSHDGLMADVTGRILVAIDFGREVR